MPHNVADGLIRRKACEKRGKQSTWKIFAAPLERKGPEPARVTNSPIILGAIRPLLPAYADGHQFTFTARPFRISLTFEQFCLIAGPSLGPLRPASAAMTTFPHGQAFNGNCFK